VDRKPARLNALTGLRCFAAINIVFFHFSNPQWFGFLAPVVNAGLHLGELLHSALGLCAGLQLRGQARAGSWTGALLEGALHAALSHLPAEPAAELADGARSMARHTHGMFWTGMVLTPLLLQGWIPSIATFLNTPAWTMSAEAFYYVLFPWLAAGSGRSAGFAHLLEDGRGLGCWAWFPARSTCLQPGRHRASGPLELRPLAVGAQIHAAAASGQLCLRRDAGRPG
jgi:peptidoglycan/LPS O-acetylase OafA/YrhL